MAPFSKGVNMKKIFLLCLAACLLFSLVGCGELPDDTMLIERAKELIPKTETFNKLFYIEGLPVDATAQEESGYRKADAAALAIYGIVKIEDSKSLMQGVWTQSYIDRVGKSSLMASVISGNTIASYVYSYDKYSKAGVFEGVMVSTDGLPIQAGVVTYDYTTLKVVSKDGERAKLEMSVLVKNQEGEEKTTTLGITLTKEKGVWLLDSSTAVVYPRDSYPVPH